MDKIKLGFFGCCSTRDIFRSPHNVKYKDDFEIVFQLQRGSLISLMQEPVQYTIESTRRIENGKEKVFSSEWIRDDLRKSLFDQIRKGIDYLLLDVYFDTLFGVLIYNDKIITNNYRDLPYTDFYSNIKNKKILNIFDNHDEFFELWKENCDKFFEYMEEEFPNTKIILNRLQGATKVIRKDGSSYISPSYVKKTEKFNPALDELQQYIINNHDVKVIDCREYAITNENHIWGRSFLHYTKDYYNLAYRRMKDILVEDKLKQIEKLNSKIKYMSKEIEVLSSENQLLIQKNESFKKEFKQSKEEKIYGNSQVSSKNKKFFEIGFFKVLIPKCYEIRKTSENGVLFFNNKTFIGIYEVLTINAFNNNVKKWKNKYQNNVKIGTYYKHDICFISIFVVNEKIRETYFEKNGKIYHIFEKGEEDKIAFDTLLYSVTFSSNLFNGHVKKIPKL